MPKPRLPYHRRFPSGMLLELLAGSRQLVVLLPALVSAIPTSAATSTSVTAIATATTAAVAGHLSQARVNLLLGLLEDIDEITRLLLVCFGCQSCFEQRSCYWGTHCQW